MLKDVKKNLLLTFPCHIVTSRDPIILIIRKMYIKNNPITMCRKSVNHYNYC